MDQSKSDQDKLLVRNELGLLVPPHALKKKPAVMPAKKVGRKTGPWKKEPGRYKIVCNNCHVEIAVLKKDVPLIDYALCSTCIRIRKVQKDALR